MARLNKPKTSRINIGKLPPRLRIPEEQIAKALDPDPAGVDSQTIRSLILWARKERIAITHITVGQVQLVMHDNALTSSLAEPRTSPGPEVRQGIYEQYGASLMAADGSTPAAAPSEAMEPTIEDDDD